MMILFEPFGTSGFQESTKYLLYLGYGTIAISIFTLYFNTAYRILAKKIERWSVIEEGILAIPSISFAALGCTLYHHQITKEAISLDLIMEIQQSAYIISILPLTFSYYRLWNLYKQGQLTESKDDSVDKGIDSIKVDIVTIPSTNKREKPLILKESELIMISSDGNYIEVYLNNS